jgi:hypothetical protein
MHWRRLDGVGREHARIQQLPGGWQLTGDLEVEESGVAARFRYRVDCDAEWRTLAALVEGEAGGPPIRFALIADAAGNWREDGQMLSTVAGALDVDLGFTPATNTLPIRRLALAIGESAPVTSAWIRFPELRLEALEQTYTREAARIYRYVAAVDGAPFTARLDTDDYGRVVHYEGLWAADTGTPA